MSHRKLAARLAYSLPLCGSHKRCEPAWTARVGVSGLDSGGFTLGAKSNFGLVLSELAVFILRQNIDARDWGGDPHNQVSALQRAPKMTRTAKNSSTRSTRRCQIIKNSSDNPELANPEMASVGSSDFL